MLFRPNPETGVPIYLQLMEQVKNAIETGALRPGEQLPGTRWLATRSTRRWPASSGKETPVTDAVAIETVDLRKSFGSTEALRGLTLSVPRGSICGFLGRNGSGKTTTLKVLLGMVRPTSGAARVFGLFAD